MQVRLVILPWLGVSVLWKENRFRVNMAADLNGLALSTWEAVSRYERGGRIVCDGAWIDWSAVQLQTDCWKKDNRTLTATGGLHRLAQCSYWGVCNLAGTPICRIRDRWEALLHSQ